MSDPIQEMAQEARDYDAQTVARYTLMGVGSLFEASKELNDEANTTERGMRAGFPAGDPRTQSRVTLLRLAADLVLGVAQNRMDEASSFWLASRVGKAPTPLDPYVVGRQRAAKVPAELVERVMKAMESI